jgi:basic amino acid/polyamine antiporter, APA family
LQASKCNRQTRRLKAADRLLDFDFAATDTGCLVMVKVKMTGIIHSLNLDSPAGLKVPTYVVENSPDSFGASMDAGQCSTFFLQHRSFPKLPCFSAKLNLNLKSTRYASIATFQFPYLEAGQDSVASLMTSLLRRLPADSNLTEAEEKNKHLGWLMLSALGIGATIGAGIFVMPGRIALLAGPGGVLSFTITGIVFLFVGICYERFARIVPKGVSAYSYVYHSIGELFAWIVAFGLFLEYSFGASAVAIGWSSYLKTVVDLQLPPFLCGSTMEGNTIHWGVNIVALFVVTLVTIILIGGGVQKSAKLNFLLVCLKMTLLAIFMVAGIRHVNPANWQPFMPKGIDGVLQGAAIAVFPYVGFDALYTFARESKSVKDTRTSTYVCILLVALLYVIVMAIATGMAPVFSVVNGQLVGNQMFVGSEASAPLANLMIAAHEDWAGKLIAAGAVIGIFNVLLVLSMGGPRIFRNMAEDGLLPPIFAKVRAGSPVFGLLVNGIIVGSVAGFVPFDKVTDIMVLGTLVAFIFVCVGALRLKLVHPLVALTGAIGCSILAYKLQPIVWDVYKISCPIGLVFYFLYGRSHSRLAKQDVPSEG